MTWLASRVARSAAAALCLVAGSRLADADDGPPAPKALPGTAIMFKPVLDVESGYDSNPDNLFDEAASPFLKLAPSLTLSESSRLGSWSLLLKSRYVDFADFADRKNRWDAQAALDTTWNLSAAEKVRAGTSYMRDFLSFSRADIWHTYTDYVLTGSDYRLRLQGRTHEERFIEDSVQGALPPNLFDVVRDRAFNYARTDGQAGFLAFTRSVLQPFIIYQAADLTYFDQAPNPLKDRNAFEQFAIAGLRIQQGAQFRVDVGWRVSRRDFEDQTINRFDSNYVDLNLFWQPNDAFKLTAVVERYFGEPSTSLGLADDVKSYGLTGEWAMSQKLRLSSNVYYDVLAPIGDTLKYRKITAGLSLTYDESDNLQYYFSALRRWAEETVSGESYDRFRIGSGVKLKY